MNTSLHILTNHFEAPAGLPFTLRKHYRARNLILNGVGMPEAFGVPSSSSEGGNLSVGQRFANGLRTGLRAASDAKVTGLVVVGIIALVVGIYYTVPASGLFFDEVTALKSQYGTGFSFVSMGLAGGILPILLGLCTGLYSWGGRALAHALFGLVVFGSLGVMSDGLYQFQNFLFGDSGRLLTVLSKIAFDQFVWTVIIANPYQLLSMLFRDSGFSPAKFKSSLSSPVDYYLTTGLPTLFNNWCFWIPLTGLVYSLPIALQVPVASLAVAFWVILLSLTMKQGES